MTFDLFFAPMRVFLEWPLLALVPALGFAGAYWTGRTRGRKLLLVPAGLWAAFAVYESYMHAWSKTVVAPIRVDLLLVTPVLYIVTAAGLIGWWRLRRHGAR